MKAMSLQRICSLIGLAVFITLVSGCSPHIDGTYQDASGMMKVEIKSGKATVTTMGQTRDVDMKQDGDKITLTVDNQAIVFTRKPDGSLDSDTIKLTKKE